MKPKTMRRMAAVHESEQRFLLKKNSGRERIRGELLLAMRHGIAGWALAQATESELLKFVEVFRKSPMN